MPDNPSILVVDDADDIRLLVRAVLSRAGWHVIEATRGTEVTRKLGNALPDVVLLDVQMPDQDGWATLTGIRREARTADLPVVICTVKAGRADRERGWRLGCDGFLTKPFSIDDLVTAVTAAVSRTPAQRLALRREQLSLISSLEATSS